MYRAAIVLLLSLATCATSQSLVATSRPVKPAAATATAATDQQVEYLAVLLEGKKIGHAVQSRIVKGDEVITTEETVLTMGRSGVSITVHLLEKAVETRQGKPLSFRSEQDGALSKQVVEGKFRDDGKVDLTTVTGGSVQHKVIDWPEGALLSEGLRLQEQAAGLKNGTSYASKSFSSETLKPLEAKIAIGPEVQVDLLGRVLRLVEVKTTIFTGSLGTIETTSYMDKDYRTLKTVTSMMGMKIEMVSCTKQFALSPEQDLDFLDRFILQSPKPLGELSATAVVSYELTPLNQAKLDIPSSDNQKATTGPDGKIRLDIRPLAAPAGQKIPYAGNDPQALAALKPGRYVQSDDEKIVNLARQAVGDEKDAAAAAHKLEAFVRQYIHKKNLTVGYASASEVVESREGDCTEHAVLLAAMCKAVGLPTQVVMGVAYVPNFGEQKDIFGPHAWVQVFIGGKWIGLDAALGAFDAGHIALVAGDGEPDNFFNLVNTLGNFKITQATRK